MRPYVFLVIGMMWLIVAILTGFGIYWPGAMTALTAGLIPECSFQWYFWLDCSSCIWLLATVEKMK